MLPKHCFAAYSPIWWCNPTTIQHADSKQRHSSEIWPVILLMLVLVSRALPAGAQGGGCTIATFASSNFNVKGLAYDPMAGDFNNDGKLDLVVGAQTSSVRSVLVMYGNSMGGFAPQTPLPVKGQLQSIALGDFNGDSHLDITSANGSDNSVSVLINDGAGNFAAPLYSDMDQAPSRLDTGDFNSDGKLDLVTVNPSTDNVSVLLNNGLGRFTVKATMPVGEEPIAITTGDFNKDERLDLAIINQNANNIAVLYGDGKGNFAKTLNFPGSNYPLDITTGDFNSDGWLDLVTANSSNSGDSVSVLLNNGTGGFNAAIKSLIDYYGAIWYDLITGDFNSDGKLDLAASHGNGYELYVLLNKDTGNFSTQLFNVPGENTTITRGDFNSDGKLDLAVASIPRFEDFEPDSSYVAILLNTCNHHEEGIWYRDADGDGFGNPNSKKEAKEQPRAYVSNALDCDDKNKTKGGPEVCDGRDNDCDGVIDNGFVLQPFYSDWDHDGYGTPKRMKMACVVPPEYVSNDGDCNDDLASVHPGAPELCDGRDNDCNGTIDDGLTLKPFYWDHDKDGYGFRRPVYACVAPPGYISVGGDFNDNDTSIHPGAVEHCDGVDEDCDGVIDNGFVQKRFYKDNDGDGWGSNSNLMAGCAPKGYVERKGDCNDKDASIHPEAAEAPNNGIDDNCNGQVDEPTTVLTQNKTGMMKEPVVTKLKLKVTPNPSQHYFSVRLESNSNVPVQLRVVDGIGRLIEGKEGVAPNATLSMGKQYRPGIYYVQVLQGSKRVSLKLIKAAQ